MFFSLEQVSSATITPYSSSRFLFSFFPSPTFSKPSFLSVALFYSIRPSSDGPSSTSPSSYWLSSRFNGVSLFDTELAYPFPVRHPVEPCTVNMAHFIITFITDKQLILIVPNSTFVASICKIHKQVMSITLLNLLHYPQTLDNLFFSRLGCYVLIHIK